MVRHTGEPLSKLQTIEVMTSLKCQIPPKFGRAKPPPPPPLLVKNHHIGVDD